MLWLEFLLPFLFLCSYGGAASIPKQTRAGRCVSCHAVDKTKLNIHLVPHTHDDVGWLKTVDQYFFGSRSKTQLAGVQYILDSVVQALLANPDRKFMYVETAFLWKWWVRQNDKTKQIVRDLIRGGQLEIIGGGWSMNDEAVTHYHSLVDQYTWGFRRLNEEFGSCGRPHVGWQIDPFGHSREQASIFSQLGFDGLFLGRIDYQDKQQRLKNKTMEFIWKGSPSLGSKADLFTVAMYNTYSPPPGFCFDVLCRDEPINDDKDSPDYNVPDRVEQFLKYAKEQASHYRTNNIILTMGEDFNYQQAEMWYTNLDRLIRYVRELRPDVNIFYSTPSCYLKAVNDADLEWSTKDDDFFPYASDPHSYWTGYFSSRPAVKYFERMGNNLLQVTKQLSVLTNFTGHDEQLVRFREAMAIMQHHDAVTGTEKQVVANDYARILYKSMETGSQTVATAISNWMTKNQKRQEPVMKIFSCMQLNISSCPHTENHNSILAIYNPLTFEINTPIRVPVKEATYRVSDLADSSVVVSQLVPVPKSVQQIPERESTATHELVFMAKAPALGYHSYKVERLADASGTIPTSTDSISNELFEIYIDENGQAVVTWKKEKDLSLAQSFHYYKGKTGNNETPNNRSSGAYIFRPNGVASKVDITKWTDHKVYKGDVVSEIHQTINEWVSQVIRIYKEQEYVEFDWLVGPIPVEDRIGKEIVTKYSSNLKSSGEFYTDSNGREMLKRKRDYRPSWSLSLEEPVSSNYYPVTSKIALEDKNAYQRLSVITDRAQGGTSMKDGEIELMIHRRLLHDDAFGVGEALNETAFNKGLVVRGSHYLYGGSTKNLDKFMLAEKTLQLKTVLRPWTLITPFAYGSTIDESPYKTPESGLNNSLPKNVHMLTLEPWIYDTVILRLEHIFEKGESETYSKPEEIDLNGLLANYTILTIRETSLGANEWVENVKRMQWRAESNEILETLETDPEQTSPIVRLNPMDIKTFLISFKPREK